jgi:aminoglycoside phosphotransferase (APT) family kinase protein
VLAACDDPSVLGACFYVMEYVDGWSCMSTSGWPAPFDHDLEARRGLAWELVDAIGKLARVDWKARGLEGFGRPEGFHERQVDRWLSHLAACRFRDIPGIDEAAAWLRGYRPKSYRPGILHGDYQFANVMYHHGAPARMAAIVDWEMATVGDPLLDLGWVVMGWPNPGEDRATMGYVDYTGMPTRAELCERYARASGLPVDEIDYYVILARFKIAIVLEGGYARYVKGGADNPKMAAFGDVVLDMARKAAELARTTALHP